ncbi:MAG: hypothetical protein JWM04_2635 [Verrucomicrobiales bacterium]|nr:hypothetical protein [Verrucomicrobiales bacterium]
MKTNNKPERSGRLKRNTTKAMIAAVALAGAVQTVQAEDAPSRTDALLNFEFSDKYLTPRGMIVQNQGLVSQVLALGFFNVYKGDTFISDVTLVGGVWNCFGTDRLPSSDSGGTKTTSWFEIDPIAGISFGFAKNFKLDVTYTAFDMQVFNIPFSQHLETKLSFNDASLLKEFALNPYVSFWKELEGKAVSNTDASPSSSYYFDVGIAPSYTFEKIGLKLEAPMRVLMADSKFYGTGAGSSSTVGLYELGVKGTVPMKFMPQGYGHWSFHAGFKYMKFEDVNLRATQGVRDTAQIYAGISTFF